MWVCVGNGIKICISIERSEILASKILIAIASHKGWQVGGKDLMEVKEAPSVKLLVAVTG